MRTNGHTCMHTYIHTCMHTYTYIHAYIHIHKYTHIHTYIHTHTYIHACIHTYMHTYIHSYIYACIHTYTHKYIHTYIHAYIHTYMHVRKQKQMVAHGVCSSTANCQTKIPAIFRAIFGIFRGNLNFLFVLTAPFLAEPQLGNNGLIYMTKNTLEEARTEESCLVPMPATITARPKTLLSFEFSGMPFFFLPISKTFNRRVKLVRR